MRKVAKKGEDGSRAPDYPESPEPISRRTDGGFDFRHVDTLDEALDILVDSIAHMNPDAVIFVSLRQPDGRTMKIVRSRGLPPIPETIKSHLPGNLLEMEFDLARSDERNITAFGSGRLIRMEDGFYGVALGELPKSVCEALERALEIDAVYTMGFSRLGKHIGGVIILTRSGHSIARMAEIESAVSAATVAILRLQAEESLRLKQYIFENTIAANSIADTKGRIIEVNDAFLRIWGYGTRDEVIGRPISQFLHDKLAVRRIVSALDSVGKWEGEYVARRKDGSIFDAYGLATIVRGRDEAPCGYQSSVIDISQLNKAMNDVRDIAKFPEEDPNPVFRISRDGTLVYWNPAGKRIAPMCGCEIGKPVPEYWQAKAEKAFQRGSPEQSEELLADRTFMATIAPIPESGYTNLYLVDITDRSRAERDLESSKEFWKRTFDSVDDLVFILDNDFRIFSVNSATAKRLGMKTEELVGKRCYEVVHGTTEPPAFCPHKRMQNDGMTHSEEVRVESLGGDFLVVASPMKDEHGETSGCVHVAKDITEAKMMARALTVQEARYHELVKSMGSGLAMYKPIDDGVDFVIADFNEAAERIERISREAVVGRRLTEVFPSIASMGFIDVLRRVNSTGQPERLPPTRYTDGRITGWRDNYVYRLPTGEIVAIYDDITEKMELMDALRRSEESYRTIVDHASDVIWRLDGDARLSFASPSLRKLLGYAPEEIVGKPVVDFFPPDEGSEVLRNLESRAMEPGGVTFECEMLASDGSRVPVEVSSVADSVADGRVSGYIQVIRDFRERRKTEDALRRSEDLFKHVFESSNVGKSITHPGGTVHVNKAFADMLGYTVKELEGRNWQELTHPKDIEESRESVEMLVRGETDAFRVLKRYLKKDGGTVWADVSSSLRRGSDGKPLHFLTTIVDISNRVKAEEEIKDLNSFLMAIRNVNQAIVREDDFDKLLLESCKILTEVRGYLDFSVVYVDERTGRMMLKASHGTHGKAPCHFFSEDGAITSPCVKLVTERNLPVVLPAGSATCEDCQMCTHGASHQTILVPMLSGRRALRGMLKACLDAGRSIHPDELLLFKEVADDLVYAGDKISSERRLLDAIKEKDILLKEIHHRVKNNLQVISSLLSIQEKAVADKDARHVLEEARNRVHSMAHIHETIYRSEDLARVDFKAYVQRISSNLYRAYGVSHHRVRLEVDIEGGNLVIEEAVPCGLILNELLSNSLKYAFPGDRHGTVSVRLKAREGKMEMLEVGDDGVGLGEGPKGKTGTIGLDLVNMLSRQLGKEVFVETVGGTRTVLRPIGGASGVTK